MPRGAEEHVGVGGFSERKRVFRGPKRVAVISFQFIAGDGCAVRLVDVFADIHPGFASAAKLHNIHIGSIDTDYSAPAETIRSDVDYLVVVESERKHSSYGMKATRALSPGRVLTPGVAW